MMKTRNKYLIKRIMWSLFSQIHILFYSEIEIVKNLITPLNPTQPAEDTRQATFKKVKAEQLGLSENKNTFKNDAIINFTLKQESISEENKLRRLKNMKRYIFVFLILLISVVEIKAQLKLNEVPSKVILEEASGGNINGEAWNSQSLKNKINLILYVAPTQQESIEVLLKKINDQNFPIEKFETTLILNTESTWIPNSIIEGKVKGKAKEDSTKTYVLDKDEVVLSEWGLSEDNPNILLIDKYGKMVFVHTEELSEKAEDKLLNKIELEIKKEN